MTGPAEKRLDGYIYEGNIGNIATSRMTNTRELYRWHNPTTEGTTIRPSRKSCPR